MPRLKPPAPLVPRSVRMPAAAWAVFDRLGGAEWLRRQVRTAEATARTVRERLAAGETHRAIAEELRISTKTIQAVKQNWFPE